MANDPNYLYMQRQNPFNSFLQGFQGGQGIITNITKNNLMSEEANRYKLLTAMKMHDEMKGLTYDNLDFYNNEYRPALMKLGVPETFLPEYKTVDELNKGLYRNEQMKASLKAKMEGPKVVPERGSVYNPASQSFMYPEVSPARQSMIAQQEADRKARFDLLSQKYGQDRAIQILKNENALEQIGARGNIEKPGSYEMVETDEGPAWSPKGKGEIIPIPGAKGKSKAGQDTDIRSKALKATQDQGIYPGDPEFETKFNTNMQIIGGGNKKAIGPPTDIGETRMYNGKRYKVIIQNGVKGIDTNSPLD